MLFNSSHFLIFFPIVVALFFVIPHRFRWAFPLVASYSFYMSWEPAYGLLILGTTIVDYVVGRLMDGAPQKHKTYLLTASLAANLGVLFTFKYFNFFFDSLEPLARYFIVDFSSPALKLLLPVGLSFYVLQSLSYTIDVYRGKRKAERHFGIFALYVSFFPQLVAGPIETSTHLLPQFYKQIVPNAERFFSGFRLMLWGYFKKIMIADNAAIIVDAIYGNADGVNGIALFAGTAFFAFQIYADFSGYSDIARGSARIMGYDLSVNFIRPYLSRSIADFWRRWHISLMHWFREYIYFPLGGSRASTLLWARNVLLIFLISGLWHGANWTFVAWGLLNALYIIIGKYTESTRVALAEGFGIARFPWLYTTLKITTTFCLTLVAWVFFRSETITKAFSILRTFVEDAHIALTSSADRMQLIIDAGHSLGVSKLDLAALIGAIGILLLVEGYFERKGALAAFLRLPLPIRWLCYYALIFIIIIGGRFGESPFIYFQF